MGNAIYQYLSESHNNLYPSLNFSTHVCLSIRTRKNFVFDIYLAKGMFLEMIRETKEHVNENKMRKKAATEYRKRRKKMCSSYDKNSRL